MLDTDTSGKEQHQLECPVSWNACAAEGQVCLRLRVCELVPLSGSMVVHVSYSSGVRHTGGIASAKADEEYHDECKH
eukprot:scaffold24294_cov113-Phaeocystis_antarctica.AAC.4